MYAHKILSLAFSVSALSVSSALQTGRMIEKTGGDKTDIFKQVREVDLFWRYCGRLQNSDVPRTTLTSPKHKCNWLMKGDKIVLHAALFNLGAEVCVCV